MSSLVDFSADSEFKKLLGRRDDVDLTVVALELARDAYPDLEFGPTLRWIADRAAELAGPVARARNEEQAIRELGGLLAGEYGITGHRESYETPDGSFLNQVIERRSGIPISLSVLYMAVANEVGLELKGVSAPGHFLTRYETLDDPFFVDAFSAGQVLPLADAVARVQSATGLPAEEALRSLEPCGPRTITIRMLNNLKALYARQGAWTRALRVQQRLLALQPAVYGERRDLALVLLKADHAGEALDLLNQCLHNCPPDEREVLEQQIVEARRSLARLN